MVMPNMSGKVKSRHGGEYMFLLLYIVILVTMYVVTFKENFTEEKLQKVVPILGVVGIITILIAILSAIVH